MSKCMLETFKRIGQRMPIFEYKEYKTYIEFKVPVLVGGKIDANELTQAEGWDDFKEIPEPFQNQILILSINLTQKFPNERPSLCLPPKLIYHPFIGFENGSVCMDSRGSNWNHTEATGAQKLIQMIEDEIPILLGTFKGENPHNPGAEKEARMDFKNYVNVARAHFNRGIKNQCSPEQLKNLLVSEGKYIEYPKLFAQRAAELGIKLLPLRRVVEEEYKDPFASDSDSYSEDD